MSSRCEALGAVMVWREMSGQCVSSKSRARRTARCLAPSLGALLACAAPPAPVAPTVAAEPQPSLPAPPPPLRPLTSEEEQLREELKTECSELAELGPRSLVHSWNLHSATDHLARKLEV